MLTLNGVTEKRQWFNAVCVSKMQVHEYSARFYVLWEVGSDVKGVVGLWLRDPTDN